MFRASLFHISQKCSFDFSVVSFKEIFFRTLRELLCEANSYAHKVSSITVLIFKRFRHSRFLENNFTF